MPVTGTVDTGKIHTALRKEYRAGESNARLGKFGGWCSVGSVKDNGDGTVEVEIVYHIGD